MNFDKLLLRVFLPDDDSWLKHANPWSTWSRFATLPFIILAIWSRVWIGWYCLIPLAILIIWVVINPTFFSKPATFERWISKAVLGERIYMNRKEVPLPVHHRLPVTILTILQTLAGLLLAYGLWKLHIHLTLLGTVSIYLSKMWFLDRMVWLYEDTNRQISN